MATELYDDIVSLILSGENLSLEGPGGTGKSYNIKHAIRILKSKGKNCVCTAATGIAAIMLSEPIVVKPTINDVDGEDVNDVDCANTSPSQEIFEEVLETTTLHAWAGCQLAEEPVGNLITKIYKNAAVMRRWTQTDVLFIDEISMVAGEFFEKLNTIGKVIRKRPDEAFGGIQIVVSGDFHQLPPVKGQWVFTTEAWDECEFMIMEFDQPKRYPNINWFNTLLRIRQGEKDVNDINLLKSRVTAYQKYLNDQAERDDDGYIDVKPTVLYSTKAEVAIMNQKELDLLDTQAKTYFAHDEYKPKYKGSNNLEKYAKFMDDAIPHEITLKVGAQVMLKYNVDVPAGLANGSRGVVTQLLQDAVKVKWLNGKENVIEVQSWEKKDEDGKIIRTQIPFILAWALTIHKCQGCTLDYVICDLGKSVFAPGQAYVALSRVRDPSGLFISNFTPGCIKADTAASEYYYNTRNE